jgi:hypothetical protein
LWHGACGTEPKRAGEHGIAHGLGKRVAAGGEGLDDEERVPRGLIEQLDGVCAVRLGELSNRVRRERRQP